MSNSDDVPRLKSFETHESESLHVIAEVDGENIREIYHGQEPGHWAIVPVDDLGDWESPGYAEELNAADLEVFGETVTVDPDESATMTLLQDGEMVVQSGFPGVYGLLRIPFERE